MFKRIFNPFQKALIEKNLCVGCTFPLNRAYKLGDISETKSLVQCKCKRRYIFDKELNIFRRATFEEEVLFLEKKNL